MLSSLIVITGPFAMVTAASKTIRTTIKSNQIMERAKGLEPSTPTLARLCSTTELHPRYTYCNTFLQNAKQHIAAFVHNFATHITSNKTTISMYKKKDNRISIAITIKHNYMCKQHWFLVMIKCCHNVIS